MKLARNIGAASLLIRSYLPARRVVAYQVVAMNSTALLAQFALAPILHISTSESLPSPPRYILWLIDYNVLYDYILWFLAAAHVAFHLLHLTVKVFTVPRHQCSAHKNSFHVNIFKVSSTIRVARTMDN